MKRWWWPALVIATITLVFALLLRRQISEFQELPPKPVKLLTISVVVDGSDRFIFTTNTVRLEHRQFNAPTDVVFDGEPWTDLTGPPSRWMEIAPTLDLSRAVIVQRRGRDLVALEHTEAGFDLYFSDTLGGEAPYVVTIAIPQK